MVTRSEAHDIHDRPPRLAVMYEPGSTEPLSLVEAFRPVCDIAWVVECELDALGSFQRLLPRLGPLIETRGEALDDTVARLRNLGIGGVMSLTDPPLAKASLIGEALGLPANPAAVTGALTSKHRQREALRESGIDTPGFVLLTPDRPLHEMERSTAALRFPVIVKPAHGSASRDTVRADTAEEALAFWSSIAPREDFLAEELIPASGQDGVLGSYGSVESFVLDGQIVSFGVTGRFALEAPFRETGSILPAPITPDVAEAAIALSEAALRALGVRWGPAHTEVMFTDTGPAVIEVNGRVGGDQLPRLWLEFRGQDFLRNAAEVALGRPLTLAENDPEPLLGSRKGPYIFSYNLLPPMNAARITSVGGIEKLSATQGITHVALLRSAGDRVDWREGSRGHILRLRGMVETFDELRCVPNLVRSAVEVAYESQRRGGE